MNSSKHNDALTIREIEYSILIKDKEKGFHELDDILRSEITRFEDRRNKNTSSENPIQDFLKTNIDRSIVIRDSTKIYFLNYKEHGSFTIQFTLLVLSKYINYGTTRQALDYLIKDTIGNYFEELLERHLPVSISVHSADNELYDIPANPDDYSVWRGSERNFLPLILASLALLVSISIGLIWFLQRSQAAEKSKPSTECQEKYLELLIDKQIDEAMQKEKSMLLENKRLESAADSGQNINDKQKE